MQDSILPLIVVYLFQRRNIKHDMIELNMQIASKSVHYWKIIVLLALHFDCYRYSFYFGDKTVSYDKTLLIRRFTDVFLSS